MTELDKRVRKAWADEIREDFIEFLRDRARQYTNIVNEGWVSAGGSDFNYYVGVSDDDELSAEVYGSEFAFESEEEPIAEFKITFKVTPVTA
jgi:hypothetical protein